MAHSHRHAIISVPSTHLKPFFFLLPRKNPLNFQPRARCSSKGGKISSPASSSCAVVIKRWNSEIGNRFFRRKQGNSWGRSIGRFFICSAIEMSGGEDYFGEEIQIAGGDENEAKDDVFKIRKTIQLALAIGATVVLGVGNRVLGKLALVPLKKYPFFLAQLSTFGYVIVYFTVLYIRYHAGIVTPEMLHIPKAPFVAIGFMEAAAAAFGMAATAMLSGASIPILSQTFLVWQILLSIIFLGRRYRYNQLLGCLLVIVGVITTVASGATSLPMPNDATTFWTLVMIFSFFLQAADSVLKESVFVESSRNSEGKTIDIFVVNSYGSVFQALFAFLLLPLMSRLWGVPFRHLPRYVAEGAACFLNVGGLASGCDGAPVVPLVFLMVNMGYNISLLHLLKISSAVVSSLASTFSVPMAVYMFTLPLPYLGLPSALPPGFVAGAAILVLGLLLYAWTPR